MRRGLFERAESIRKIEKQVDDIFSSHFFTQPKDKEMDHLKSLKSMKNI